MEIQGTPNNDVLTGTVGDDIIQGHAGDDTLDGLEGNDRLDGGTGADSMTGGLGDDVFIVDNAGDQVIEAAGGGIDEVRFGLTSYTLPANIEIGTSTASTNSVINGNGLDNVLTGTQGWDTINGGAGADTMIGLAGNDWYFVDNPGDTIVEINTSSFGSDTVETSLAAYTLPVGVELVVGNASQQILTGNDGDNWLTSNGGGDTLIGGKGNDLYQISAGDVLVELAGEGIDLVRTSLTYYVLPEHFEELQATSFVSAQTLIGNAANNRIIGTLLNNQSDTIDGGLGADLMIGYHGSDVYYVDNALDSIIEESHHGAADEVRTSADYVLPNNVELLTALGANGLVLTGNHLANTIRGGTGNDVLNGGSGADQLIGGLGDDRYMLDLSDTIVEAADGGFDTVESSYFSHTLGANLEGLTLLAGGATNGTGNGLDNVLIGNGNGNLLDGGAGADVMSGGNSNDIYVVDNVGDVVVELAGEGEDEIRTTLAVTDISALQHVENLTGISAAGQTLIGNALGNFITGGSGNDHLDGGVGVDELDGGDGGDVYVVDANDFVYENGIGGVDEIRTAAAAYSILSEDYVENLTGLSDAGQALTGNFGANVIVGGAGNDIIDGYSGADTLRGGLGDDVYIIGNNSVSVIELAGGGTDEIRSLLDSFSLAGFDNVENLSGSRFGHTLTGNGLANVITGSTYRDVIDGAAGADTMIGGEGGDDYFVDNAGDVVIELAGGDRDLITTTLAVYSIANIANVENLDGRSSAGHVLTGNDFDNDISGWQGNDVIDGGLGADRMYGFSGDDIFFVDSASDLVVEFDNGGTDEIRTALSAYNMIAQERVEKLTGISASGQALTGNSLANVIAGGSGNDVIDGGSGADAMAGGLGNDVYAVDNMSDTITELDGAGTDEVRTALASFSIAGFANVENLTGLGSAGQSLTGNGFNNVIDGGLGADTMAGGGGHDVYIVDNAGDTVVELDGAGEDEVRSGFATVSLASFANVENLTGGSADQSLTGNSGNNRIDGGAGADAMTGGAGNDTYIVDNAGDVVTELAGEGTDEVRTALGSKAPPDRLVYVLPDFIENLTGTSAGAQGVRDNSLDNVITMGGGHDLVVADAGGVDTVNGGGGNDFIYHGDKLTAADITNGGAGSDTIGLLGDYGSGLTFTATNLVGVERMALYTSLYLPGTGPNNYNITMHDANVAAGTEFFVTAASLQSNESLVFNGAAETNGRFTVHGGGGADTIIGGAGGDFVIGNGGNDSLYGLGGQDFLIGGLGADQLRGGAGGDRFLYQSVAQSTAASMDQILDFQHADRIDLSAIDANGNAGDGNSAFAFIGSEAFHNVAGELRAWQNGGNWFVEGDTNGDGLADLIIQVTLPDATPLGGADFIL